MSITSNSPSVLPIPATHDWRPRKRRRFKRWLFRLMKRPLL